MAWPDPVEHTRGKPRERAGLAHCQAPADRGGHGNVHIAAHEGMAELVQGNQYPDTVRGQHVEKIFHLRFLNRPFLPRGGRRWWRLWCLFLRGMVRSLH